VLGVQVDTGLRWREHAQQAAQKGNTAFEALSCINASTWGPSMKRSRLLYTAVVRPAILYGSEVWGMRNNGNPPASSLIRPLKCLQNRCLRKVMGACKRTPTAALERESNVPPVDLHMEHKAMKGAIKTTDHPVTAKIKQVVDTVWTSLRRPAGGAPAKRRRSANPVLRPKTAGEGTRRQALIRVEEQAQRRPGGKPAGPLKALDRWLNLEWEQRWTRKAGRQKAATWETDWTFSAHQLYEGLPKYEATALFLLRTEVLGLNAWLASVGVPGVDKRCPSGWPAQTVRHILLFCPTHAESRAFYFQRAGRADLYGALSTPASAHQAARWLTASGLLGQFSLAQEIVKEDTSGPEGLAHLDEWTAVQGTERDHPPFGGSKFSKGRPLTGKSAHAWSDGVETTPSQQNACEAGLRVGFSFAKGASPS